MMTRITLFEGEVGLKKEKALCVQIENNIVGKFICLYKKRPTIDSCMACPARGHGGTCFCFAEIVMKCVLEVDESILQWKINAISLLSKQNLQPEEIMISVLEILTSEERVED